MKKFTFPGPGASCSLHNHSVFSDGASTLEEIVQAGKKAGLRTLGLSDHWVEHPENGSNAESWAMPQEKLDEYVETLLKLRKEYADETFDLKIGLEVDFFFENISDVLARLKKYPLDYLIGSVHFCGIFSIDSAAEDWSGLTEEAKDNICCEYYRKLTGAADCGGFNFIGHLDLPKKFALIDNNKYLPNALQVLDAAAKNSGAIELNTSGWYKNCAEQYPSEAILREAYKRNIPVAVNADAHCADHLTRGFAEACELLNRIGYNF